MFGRLVVLLYQNRSLDQSEWFMLPPTMSGDTQFNHSSIHTLNDPGQVNVSAQGHSVNKIKETVSEPRYFPSELGETGAHPWIIILPI